MIKLNFISRISLDKNFFVDLVYLVYKLKNDHNTLVNLYFIGPIENVDIYEILSHKINELNVQDLVSFSKRSIRYHEMSEEVKSGYFINYSVGWFLGYSSLECMQQNLKTIFYNIDPHYSHSMIDKYSCYCSDLNSLINLIRTISMDRAGMDSKLLLENKQVRSQFVLQNHEASVLRSILLGESAYVVK